MSTTAVWLLVVCAGYLPTGECDRRSGVSATLVSEQQCKAVLNLRVINLVAWCIAPTGETLGGKQ